MKEDGGLDKPDGLTWAEQVDSGSHLVAEDTSRQRRDEALRANYGITLLDYELMLEAQGGRCAVCGLRPEQSQRALAVDHCHRTRMIRGILCQLCNTGLGSFRDEPERLRRAAEYLERRRAK